MENSTFTQDVERLESQLKPFQEELVVLEVELRAVEAEIATLNKEQAQFSVLQDICHSLDQLEDLNAGHLFWQGLEKKINLVEHRKRILSVIRCYAEQEKSLTEKKCEVNERISSHQQVINYLQHELDELYDQEESRLEEFVIVREIKKLPYRKIIMPWTVDKDSESYFYRCLGAALLLCLIFGALFPLVNVPIPDRENLVVEVPERFAMLLKEEHHTPPPAPVVEESKPKKLEPKKAKQKTQEPEIAKNEKPPKAAKPAKVSRKETGKGNKPTKRKAETLGVLAFKSNFNDLIDDVPVAKLGASAKVTKLSAGIAGGKEAHRSLVSINAKGGTSQGISNFGVSRDIGNGGNGSGAGGGSAGQIGGVATAKVTSDLADLVEEAGRPLSDGMGITRTDEEIQIVLDRYKATLYRIYHKALRNDPTLQGKLLVHLSILPDGSVSMCEVQSTSLASDELVAKIIDRIKRFNFGEKDGVPIVTVNFPIDFLPAG